MALSTNIQDAILDIAKSLKGVFKKHTLHSREVAWDRISDKRGNVEVQKIIKNPNRELSIFQKLAFREWLEEVDPRPREALWRAVSSAIKTLQITSPEVFEYDNSTGQAKKISVPLELLKIKLEDRGLVPPNVNSTDFANEVAKFRI